MFWPNSLLELGEGLTFPEHPCSLSEQDRNSLSKEESGTAFQAVS